MDKLRALGGEWDFMNLEQKVEAIKVNRDGIEDVRPRLAIIEDTANSVGRYEIGSSSLNHIISVMVKMDLYFTSSDLNSSAIDFRERVRAVAAALIDSLSIPPFITAHYLHYLCDGQNGPVFHIV